MEQVYNQRMVKNSPRYRQGAQSRNFQDYMANINSQKFNTAQTFGNLQNQVNNQSFYDRAVGRPQGLSGGLEQQYSTFRNAASAQAAGQVQQQRFQAFNDIAAQEAQASQFARAQGMQDQQFQMQEMQLNQQRYAQAQEILKSQNLTDAQKQEQLTTLGMTAGEVDRMTSPGAGAMIGGATTITAAATAKAVYKKIQMKSGANNLLETISASDEIKQVTETSKNLTTAKDELSTKLKTAKEAQAKLEGKQASGQALTPEETTQLNDIKSQLDDVIDADGNITQKGLNTQLKEATDAADEGLKAIDKKRTDMLDDLIQGKGDKSKLNFEGTKKAVDALDDAVKYNADGTIKKASGKKVADMATLAKTAKANKKGILKVGTKKVLGKTFAVLGTAVGVYFLADSVSMILTGRGLMAHASNLVKGDGIQTQGGLLGLGQ